MINIVKPPISKYSNGYENSKFSVTWSIFIFLVVVFSGLTTFHLLSSDPNITTSAFALFFSVLSLFFLYKTRKYNIVAIIATISGSIICHYAMFVIDDSERISDLMWLILITFYAFFTLGSTWGGIFLILNLSGMLLKVTMFPVSAPEPSSWQHMNTIINISISTLAVGFIIHKLIKSSESSNKELKDLNDKLAIQNDEKTALLKEIHHRVKNNLQVVSSLLRLQASELTDIHTKDQFNEAVSRISSMALIHEKMYQKEDLANLDLKVYLDSLIEELMMTYSTVENMNVIIDSNLEHMEIKNLVPIALIFNELITNSLKHAFIDKESGEISISIKTNEQDVLITYMDNGSWIKTDNEYSFGLTLIDTFTEQLDGKYTLNHEKGTEYQFCFSTPRK